MARAALSARVPAQTGRLHLQTFAPSKGPKGIRLNAANQALKKVSSARAPTQNKPAPQIAAEKVPTRKAPAKIRLDTGPASAVRPQDRISDIPWTRVAPGAAKRKPTNAVSNEKMRPNGDIRNSAQNPCRWA